MSRNICSSIAACAVLVLGAVAFSSTALAQTGNLSISVTDESGSPIAGVGIYASTSESLTSKSGTTDANGQARIVGLYPSTKYVVALSKEGYQLLRNDAVQVTSERTFNLSYVLQTSTDILEEVVVTGRSGMGQLVDTPRHFSPLT